MQDDVVLPYDFDYEYILPHVKCRNLTKLMYYIIYERKIDNSRDKILKQIKKYPDNIDAINSKNLSALFLAALYSNTLSSLETVRLLIENKANVNIYTSDNFSILQLCSQYSNYYSSNKTIELLLDHGADINYNKQFGAVSALKLACTNSSTNSNIETVKLLINRGAKIDKEGENTNSELICTCYPIESGYNIETIKILLNAGANINSLDIDNKTALIHSTVEGNDFFNYTILKKVEKVNMDIIRLFLDYGIDYTIKDKDNKTFMDYLSEENKQIAQNVINTIQTSKLIKANIEKDIVLNVNDFLHRPDNLRSKILSIKWNLDSNSYNQIKMTNPELIDYFGIYDSDDFISKITNCYRFI
ncbi:putative ankyrin repeat protein [Powai lake megavirus]|uniref:Putative ankyrin repeat protein n=1 Tax=Powai lake megavirus TaxID=1842663 RepID=A0A167RJI8_9VIRU|nr:putative ankyrin repeat protein [Powai lake megavirus]ANB50759.1 putative ankyrin repeat protein [Powai lake megavirus]